MPLGRWEIASGPFKVETEIGCLQEKLEENYMLTVVGLWEVRLS